MHEPELDVCMCVWWGGGGGEGAVGGLLEFLCGALPVVSKEEVLVCLQKTHHRFNISRNSGEVRSLDELTATLAPKHGATALCNPRICVGFRST